MDVTRTYEQRPGRRVRNKRSDRRQFSRTADRAHGANMSQGRPKRGGVRL